MCRSRASSSRLACCVRLRVRYWALPDCTPASVSAACCSFPVSSPARRTPARSPSTATAASSLTSSIRFSSPKV
eukprot:6500826-Pyramimonas_sp.AAC.1